MNKILKKYIVPAGILASSLFSPIKANAEVLGTMRYVSTDPLMVETCLATAGILEKIDPNDRNSFINKLSDDFKKYNSGMEAQLDLKHGDSVEISRDEKSNLVSVTTEKQGGKLTISNAKLLPYVAPTEAGSTEDTIGQKPVVEKSLETKVAEVTQSTTTVKPKDSEMSG